MMKNYQDHVDLTCNVLNVTSLAEDVADHFGIYENEEIPEWVYDMGVIFEAKMIEMGLVNS
jgi:hypothetical protein